MSSVNYIKLSSRVITLLVIAVIIGACLRSSRPQGTDMVSDRLTNFLITESLPLGHETSSVRSEVTRCSSWLRNQLKQDPAQHFRLDSGLRVLTATATGKQLMLSPELFTPLQNLNAFFHLNAAVDRQLFTRENIHAILQDQTIKAALTQLIQEDSHRLASETGGVVLLDPAKQTLKFHVIRSDNEIWYHTLAEQESPEQFVLELKKIRSTLPYLKVRANRTISIIENEVDTEAEQRQEMARFLDLLLTHTRYSYVLDQRTQYSTIAQEGWYGYYMGVFHIHPPDNPPSIEDKIGSLLRKNFVVVPRDPSIEVHYLDFTGDFTADPEIITL